MSSLGAFATFALMAALDIPEALPEREPDEEACVLLLHGLGRSRASMRPMAWALKEAGFKVINPGYPSRAARVQDLTRDVLPEALARCECIAPRVHFVTHSMGAILLRQAAMDGLLPRGGRAVLLGPPNRGSEIVDRFGHWPIFDAINGPAGRELGTGQEALPARLPPLDGLEVGIIAGTRALNPLYSAVIRGRNDGKVSLRSAFAHPARDRIALNVSHTWMMMAPRVIELTIAFLKEGAFGESDEGSQAGGRLKGRSGTAR